MSTKSNVVGATPLSIPSSTGGQRVVPLSALEFDGSDLQVRSGWASAFDAAETATLLTIARARLATGELARPPLLPPAPALVVTATTAGPESNDIVVTAVPDSGPPGPDTEITVSVVQQCTYAGLTSAADAAQAIGTDKAPTADTDPPLGTGPIRVKSGSFDPSGTDIPDAVTDKAVPNTGLAVKKGSSALFTLMPGDAVTELNCLTVSVTPTADAFTVTATYDSTAAGASTVTLLTIGALPPELGDVITLTAPPAGAAVPAATPAGGIQLSGGGPGQAASAILYTSAGS